MMKYLLFFGFFITIICNSVVAQNISKDTLKEVTTIGIFDGEIINKYGYKINEYYISLNEISSEQVELYKGKKVAITGKIKIEYAKEKHSIQSSAEDKKYILNPKFTIIYNSREPLLDKDE